MVDRMHDEMLLILGGGHSDPGPGVESHLAQSANVVDRGEHRDVFPGLALHRKAGNQPKGFDRFRRLDRILREDFVRLALLRVAGAVLPDLEGLDRGVIFLGQDDERVVFQTHPLIADNWNSPVLRAVSAEGFDLGAGHDGTELGVAFGCLGLLEFFSGFGDRSLFSQLHCADLALLLVSCCESPSFLGGIPGFDAELLADHSLHLGHAFDRGSTDEHLLAGNQDRLARRQLRNGNYLVEHRLIADDDDSTAIFLEQFTPVAGRGSLPLVPVPQDGIVLGDFAWTPIGTKEFVGLEEADDNSVFHVHFCGETSLYRALVDNVHLLLSLIEIFGQIMADIPVSRSLYILYTKYVFCQD